jgi:DNA polymerase III sliding clamp (beta) subunit (PCNA family)
MKTQLSRNLLESALNRCFEACERKVSESEVNLEFCENKLKLTTKGPVTYYEETIPTISCDDDNAFSLKTSMLLEFVKHVGSEVIILSFSPEKKSCMVSTDTKKSKIAIPTLTSEFHLGQVGSFDVQFEIENSHEFLSKMMHSMKFCSNDSHPFDSIHCKITKDTLEVKATNGPSFYSSKLDIISTGDLEVLLPKKSPVILKNIFLEHFKKCSVNSRAMQFESESCKLTIFIAKAEDDSISEKILELTTQTADAKIKVSVHEISKTLKFFCGIFDKNNVDLKIEDGILSIRYTEGQTGAIETVTCEECSGSTETQYNPKSLLDCLDSIQSSWVNMDFIKILDGFFLCKLTNTNTIILLCPAKL